MSRVQFRADDALVQVVREAGKNPNEVAKEAFVAAVRRLEADRWLARMASFKIKPFASVADDIRQMRDER